MQINGEDSYFCSIMEMLLSKIIFVAASVLKNVAKRGFSVVFYYFCYSLFKTICTIMPFGALLL